MCVEGGSEYWRSPSSSITHYIGLWGQSLTDLSLSVQLDWVAREFQESMFPARGRIAGMFHHYHHIQHVYLVGGHQAQVLMPDCENFTDYEPYL